MVILYRKNSFKLGFKASRYKNSNENQIQFGEITEYAFESLKFPKTKQILDLKLPSA